MSTSIAKFGGRYMLWSSVTDAPKTTLMTLAELRQHTIMEDGYEGLRDLDSRLERVEQHGTSSRMGDTTKSLLRNNHAGPRESRVSTEAEMVAMFGGPEGPPHWGTVEPLNLQQRMEVYDYTDCTDTRLPVKQVVSVSNGFAFVELEVPNVEGVVPVLIRLDNGDILNKGFKYLAARNVPAGASSTKS